LDELKNDQAICPALPEEIRSTVSLPQLLIVLRERHQTQENICNWVASAFGKLISELESGRINYYNDSDWEIKPPPGRGQETTQLTNVDAERAQSHQSTKLPNKILDSVEEINQQQNSNIQLLIFTSWPFFSVVCGISVVIFAIVLWLIPSVNWKAIIASLTGLGVIVAITIQSLNPINFYRRWLSYVIPGGIFVNALGFTFDAFFTSGSSSGSFQWNGTASGLFFISWAIVVLGLVWGDSQQKR